MDIFDNGYQQSIIDTHDNCFKTRRAGIQWKLSASYDTTMPRRPRPLAN